MDAKFSAAASAYYTYRDASEMTKPRYKAAAMALVSEYADASGMDVVDAVCQVADWVDENLPVDGFPADH